MQQYSPRNQELIRTQLPEATDCRPISKWNAAGFKVRKGSKALRIFTPTGIGRTFDISQVEPAPQNTGKQARRVRATIAAAAAESEYDLYANETAGMDTAPSFADWQNARLATALGDPWNATA